MQSVFLGHTDEPFTFIYKGKYAVQVTKHSAYVDAIVENLCQSGVTAHNFTPNSPIAGWLTIEKTTTCEDVTLSDVQAEIRTFLQGVGLANIGMQSGELTTPWYEALAAYMPPPPDIPPITVTYNGQPLTIVRRGADAINEDDDELITVEDDNGGKYVVGWLYEQNVLTTDADVVPVIPEGYDVIDVAYADVVVPQDNWLLAKWLKDNYNVQFKDILFYEKNGSLIETDMTLSCIDSLLVGATPGEESDNVVWYSDEAFNDETGLLNCSGHFTQAEPPQGYYSFEVLAVEDLATAINETELCEAWTGFILALNNHIAYNWPLT